MREVLRRTFSSLILPAAPTPELLTANIEVNVTDGFGRFLAFVGGGVGVAGLIVAIVAHSTASDGLETQRKQLATQEEQLETQQKQLDAQASQFAAGQASLEWKFSELLVHDDTAKSNDKAWAYPDANTTIAASTLDSAHSPWIYLEIDNNGASQGGVREIGIQTDSQTVATTTGYCSKQDGSDGHDCTFPEPIDPNSGFQISFKMSPDMIDALTCNDPAKESGVTVYFIDSAGTESTSSTQVAIPQSGYCQDLPGALPTS